MVLAFTAYEHVNTTKVTTFYADMMRLYMLNNISRPQQHMLANQLEPPLSMLISGPIQRMQQRTSTTP